MITCIVRNTIINIFMILEFNTVHSGREIRIIYLLQNMNQINIESYIEHALHMIVMYV